MATNKNQHFVPRCHLKPFTVGAANAAVHLFNLDADRAIGDAPVRNQCSRDYLYGQDPRLEAAIQSVEGPYGATVARLRTEDAVPTGPDHIVLRRFILLQHMRTEAAALLASRMMAAVAELPDVLEDGEAFDLKTMTREAVIAAMRHYGRSMRIVDDLQLTVVRNRSHTPFFTSDDPAVLTNRWHLQNRRTRGLGFGVKSAGLIMLLPLAPELLVVLHDPDVYVVPHRHGVMEIEADAEAEALNAHQVLNCAANLYFGKWDDRQRIAEAARATRPLRLDPRHRTTYAVRAGVDGEHVRYDAVPLAEIVPDPERDVLVHTQILRPVPARWPGFIHYRRDGRVYSNGTRAGFVRRGCIEAGFVQGEGYRRVRL